MQKLEAIKNYCTLSQNMKSVEGSMQETGDPACQCTDEQFPDSASLAEKVQTKPFWLNVKLSANSIGRRLQYNWLQILRKAQRYQPSKIIIT